MSGRAPEAGSPPATSLWGRDLSAALLGTAAMALPVFLLATMAVQMRGSLHFGPTGLGLAIGGYYLGAATCSVPGSRLAEAIGGARVMRLLLLAGAAVELAIAEGATTWVTLSVLLIVSGALSGAMSPGTNLFLARRSARERQGFVFGLKQAAVPLASLLGGLAVPGIALSVGWRWAFVAAGVVTLGSMLLVPASRTPLADRRRQRREQPPPEVDTLPLIVLGAAFGLGILAASGCIAFLVSAATALGIANGTAGLLTAAAAGAAIAVRVAVGAAADRRQDGHFRVVAAMVGVGVLGYLALAVGTADHSHLLFVVGAVVGLGVGWGWNGLFTFAIVRAHPAAPAAATGVTQVGGRVGGMIGPAAVGAIAGQVSYTVAWFVAGGTGVLAALAIVAGSRLLDGARATRVGTLADRDAETLPILGT